MFRRTAIALLLAAGLAVAATPALAGKGGNGKGGAGLSPPSASISLNESNPALGSWVTFTTSYPQSTKNPRVQVMCYQGDNLVYGEAGSPDHAFQLGGASSDWLRNGGPASCKADLMDLYSTGQGQQVDWLNWTRFDAAG